MNLTKRHSVLNSAKIVVIVVVLGKVFGLAKQIITSAIYGTTIETDMISLSLDLVSTVQYIFAQAILSAFTVIYLRSLSRDKKKADELIKEASLLFVLISLSFAVIIVLFSPIIAKILAPTYSTELRGQLSTYLKIFSLLLLPFVMSVFYESILNAHSKFVLKELSTVIQNIVISVFLIVLGKNLGINGLVISPFVYSVAVLLFLILCTRFTCTKGLWGFRLFNNSENIKELAKMMIPLLIGNSLIYVNQQVDKIIVSGLEEGSVTALSYSSSLSNMVLTVFTSLIAITYTKMASSVAVDDIEQSNSAVKSSVKKLVTLAIPISIISFVCAEDIVSIVLMRGSFDEHSVFMTSSALKGYSLSFVPFLIKNIYAKIQYTHKDTKDPMYISIVGISVNITLSIVLGKYLGIFGVALASSVAEVISAVLNYFVVKKKYNYVIERKAILLIVIWIITAIGLYFGLNFLFEYLNSYSSILRFAIITFVGFLASVVPYTPLLVLKRAKKIYYC